MQINTIYAAFDGEQNFKGIGAPTVFVRKQGCHIRCYLSTLGLLCDTPEALSNGKDEGKAMEVADIVREVDSIARPAGIDKVTFTGGDPLFGDYREIRELVASLVLKGYYVSIETSGTIFPKFLFDHFEENQIPRSRLCIVSDYKLKSAGINPKLNRVKEFYPLLGPNDYIKFVVKDEMDMSEVLEFGSFAETTGFRKPQLVVGPYWSEDPKDMDVFDIFQVLRDAGMLGIFSINAQVHQFAKQHRLRVKGHDVGKDI